MRLISSLLLLLLSGLTSAVDARDEVAQTLQWRVLRTLPHDTAHYTQGLVVHRGELLESAGGYGRSALYVKSLENGETLRSARVSRNWFAEGIAVWDEQIVMLTWREQIAQVFDMSLRPLRRMRYHGEGWGLTHDGQSLIVSDGTPTLRFVRPDDFRTVRTLLVRDRNRPVAQLNELEYAHGMIYANVWRTDRIAVIDPTDGLVRGWLDLSALRDRFDEPEGWDPVEHVLNGIAHDARTGSYYVTGKCWPLMFEIEIEGLSERSPRSMSDEDVGTDSYRKTFAQSALR